MTIFQKILNGEIPSVKIYEDDLIYSFMDAFPQSKGHVLIIPKKEEPNLFSVDDESLKAIILFSKKLAIAQKKALNADGIKIMQLNGEAAGQTVFHYHMHLIPVWNNEILNGHAEKIANIDELQETAKKIISELKI